MKFSNLPRLIFKAKNGNIITLVAPELAPHQWCFAVTIEFSSGKSYSGGRANPLNPLHAAHAFFASQISLEDYHAPA